jgi:hypothetical protein
MSAITGPAKQLCLQRIDSQAARASRCVRNPTPATIKNLRRSDSLQKLRHVEPDAGDQVLAGRVRDDRSLIADQLTQNRARLARAFHCPLAPPKLIAGKQRLRVPCAARFPLLTYRPGAPMLGAWAFDFTAACACFPASA